MRGVSWEVLGARRRIREKRFWRAKDHLVRTRALRGTRIAKIETISWRRHFLVYHREFGNEIKTPEFQRKTSEEKTNILKERYSSLYFAIVGHLIPNILASNTEINVLLVTLINLSANIVPAEFVCNLMIGSTEIASAAVFNHPTVWIRTGRTQRACVRSYKQCMAQNEWLVRVISWSAFSGSALTFLCV